MVIVYMSLSGNTRKFATRLHHLGYPTKEINIDNCQMTIMEEDFVLIAPTYEFEVTNILNDFLESFHNLEYCRGVIGNGNRNFNDLYCFTAIDLCEDYNLPLLYKYELQGTAKDVKNLQIIIERAKGASFK